VLAAAGLPVMAVAGARAAVLVAAHLKVDAQFIQALRKQKSPVVPA